MSKRPGKSGDETAAKVAKPNKKGGDDDDTETLTPAVEDNRKPLFGKADDGDETDPFAPLQRVQFAGPPAQTAKGGVASRFRAEIVVTSVTATGNQHRVAGFYAPNSVFGTQAIAYGSMAPSSHPPSDHSVRLTERHEPIKQAPADSLSRPRRRSTFRRVSSRRRRRRQGERPPSVGDRGPRTPRRPEEATQASTRASS